MTQLIINPRDAFSVIKIDGRRYVFSGFEMLVDAPSIDVASMGYPHEPRMAFMSARAKVEFAHMVYPAKRLRCFVPNAGRAYDFKAYRRLDGACVAFRGIVGDVAYVTDVYSYFPNERPLVYRHYGSIEITVTGEPTWSVCTPSATEAGRCP